MNRLFISGVDATSRPSHVRFDEYVPLSFSSYDDLLGGVRDIRLGNQASSFLEISLGLNSKTLRGFTLLFFHAVHLPKAIETLPQFIGLPMVEVDENLFFGRQGAQWMDCLIDFSIGIGNNFIEIDFGLLYLSDQMTVSGRVEFFLSSGCLAGIRLRECSEVELDIIREMAVGAPSVDRSASLE